MKLNLDRQFLGLKGEPIKGDKMADILANALAMSNTGSPARMVTWAVNLINNGEIEVGKDDVKFLVDFIERNNGLINLAKCQLTEELEKLKD